MFAACGDRRLDQVQRPFDVVAPIGAGLFHTIAHLAKRGKMHDGDRLVLFKRGVNLGAVQQVTLHERAEFYCVTPAGDQIIEGNGGMPCRGQRLARVRPDIARTAGDQDIRHTPVPIVQRLLRCGFTLHDVLQIRTQIIAQLFTCQPKGHGGLQET